MVQQVKESTPSPNHLSFHPWDPHGAKREVTPQNYPLTPPHTSTQECVIVSTCACVCVRAHTHTHEHTQREEEGKRKGREKGRLRIFEENH